ncbi:MAG TPA: TetR/AcrR family transcriptional regulator [Acidimicrobiales bacterium]|nr:TetR/AcrR family transcriptional regulator [Acidimicrobiales bacterium]
MEQRPRDSHDGPLPAGGENRKLRKGERARLDFLQAAKRVAGERGFAAASVPAIVLEAGRSQGNFYQYFSDKRDVFRTALLELWLDLEAQSREIWRPDDPAGNVRATVRRYVESFDENKELWRLLDQSAATEPEFAELRRHSHRRFIRHVQRGLELSVAPTTFGALKPEIVAQLLGSMLHEACRQSYLEGPWQEPAVLADHIATLWVRAIRLESES